MACEDDKEYPAVSPSFLVGTFLTYIASIFLLIAFCSPYWLQSYEESFSNFGNMGLWEYCFINFQYPFYQVPVLFEGCNNIFSHEYYVLRDYLLPVWLMTVQTCVTLALIFVFLCLSVMSFAIVRWPLKFVLKYEWILIRLSLFGCGISAFLMFLAVSVFGANAYRRDWLMYPKFNTLSWSYAFAVIASIILTMATLILRGDAKRSYDERNRAKNLVMQMQMQEQSYHSQHHSSHSKTQQGYI